MQWLAAICVRRPVFTWVIAATLVVVGAASIFGLGVDRFPNIDFPGVAITTVLPGASPEQIETEVTEPIEEAVNTVSGLDILRSDSYEGLSVVFAQFVLEKNADVAAQEVRDKVDLAFSRLPVGTEKPRILRIDPAAAPVMLIAVRSERSQKEVTELADQHIRRRLENVSGVGSITILGGAEREIQIVLDPDRLRALGLGSRDVQRALASENVELPGGEVQRGDRTLQLRVRGRITEVEDFERIPIATVAGQVVRVSDVAEVRDGEVELSSAASLNGDSVVIVQIAKQSGQNTVAVVDALEERIEELRGEIPRSFSIEIVRDESEFIRKAVGAIQEHLVLGSILAALVVLLFLRNGRSTVIAALAIPTSIVSTFALLAWMDLTLNVLTLLGLTLSVGIVIDDAIVVLENIVRYVEEKGMSPRRASVLATKEIGLAVLATTLSLVAVFLPIAFMGGIVGRFMSSFGFTMSFSIVVSLFISFTLTPMLCSRWLRGAGRPSLAPPEPEALMKRPDDFESDPVEKPAESKAVESAGYLAWAKGERTLATVGEGGHASRGGLYGRLEAAYMKLLARAMRRRWIVGVAAVVVLAMIVPLGIAVPKNFLPFDDESRFELTYRAPEGSSLAQTRLIGERIGRQIRALDGVHHTVLTAGSAPGDPTGRGSNEASIYVGLVPPDERERDQQEIMQAVRDEVLPPFNEEGLRSIVSPINVFGGSGADSAAIQYVVSGPDIEKLGEYSTVLLERMRAVPGVVDADVSLVTGRPSYDVRIDRQRAADLGVGVVDIAQAMQVLVGGLEVTTFAEAGEQYEVRLRAAEGSRMSPDVIARMPIPTRAGTTVRLSDVAEIVEATGPASIEHLSRQRQVMIYANVDATGSEGAVTQALDRARAELDMESGYDAQLLGRSRELGNAARSFLIAIVLSFTFMYLVLAAQFESWLLPLSIMSSLPLTVPFALFSVLVLGQSLNIFAMLGILVLFGVVKKNSILQVDHIRDLRRRGYSRVDAIIVGNRDRLRPILMTTLAFVAGMFPLMASSGAGAGTNRAMASVIIGGQLLSLLLTMIATPVLYTVLDDIAHARATRALGRGLRAPFLWVDAMVSRGSLPPPAPRPEPEVRPPAAEPERRPGGTPAE